MMETDHIKGRVWVSARRLSTYLVTHMVFWHWLTSVSLSSSLCGRTVISSNVLGLAQNSLLTGSTLLLVQLARLIRPMGFWQERKYRGFNTDFTASPCQDNSRQWDWFDINTHDLCPKTFFVNIKKGDETQRSALHVQQRFVFFVYSVVIDVLQYMTSKRILEVVKQTHEAKLNLNRWVFLCTVTYCSLLEGLVGSLYVNIMICVGSRPALHEKWLEITSVVIWCYTNESELNRRNPKKTVLVYS